MSDFIDIHLNQIKAKNFSNPEFELRTLLNHCSNNNIFLNNFQINKINLEKFNKAFRRRMNHEPISKIFNKKEFWSLNFYVNQYVLDPRPESEFLIEAVLKYFSDFKSDLKICDLGTGSGCLAITLAKIFKNSQITATDVSNKSLEVAKKNAKIHNVFDQIKFVNCDWHSDLEKFDFIISNPPYLTSNEYEKCNINIKNFEPKLALYGGFDGLMAYKKIAKFAHSILNKNSLLFLEIGNFQTINIKKLFQKNKIKVIKIIKDYQQINRVLVLKKL